MILPSLAWTVVIALAVYRLVRIICCDSISAPLRAKFYGWAWDDSGPGEPTHRSTFRAWVHELLTCPHCLGVWVAFAGYAAWRWGGDVALAVIAVLAIAGAQSIAVSALPDDSVDV